MQQTQFLRKWDIIKRRGLGDHMEVIAIGESLVSLTPKSAGFLRHATGLTPRVAGSETNVLIGLSRLGHSTGWISKLGNDEWGKMVLSKVKGEGIDTSQVLLDASHPTGIFFKEILHDSDVRISYYRENSAASTMSTKDLDESYFENSKYLFITGITPALSENCKDTIFQAIDLAKAQNLTIVFDPNIRRKLWAEDIAKKTILDIAKKVDIVLPGINEGFFLFGTKDHTKIADHFLSLGVSMVVVKLGEKGAYYCTDDESDLVPAYQIKQEVDPVGAGDGFAAGLMSGLLDNLGYYESVKRACFVGALATTIEGDYEGLPDRDLLNEMLDANKLDNVNR